MLTAYARTHPQASYIHVIYVHAGLQMVAASLLVAMTMAIAL